MLAALEQPIPPRHQAFLAGGTVGMLALYCLAYNALQHQQVTLGEALAWPIANVVPILIGLELAKRRSSWAARGVILAASLALALAIGALITTHQYLLAFEAVRRLPVILACIAVLALFDFQQHKRSGGVQQPAALPVPAEAIDWVEAAANYVVLHGKGFRIIHRATLGQTEAALGAQGFLRIHRSRLVARRAIVRVRPHDVILADGKSLPTGARFRPLLDSVESAN